MAALAVILLAGLLLRGGYLFSVWHAPDFASPVLDPQLNDYWARALVTGNWAPPAHADDPEIRTTPYGRPPGYPYFLAAAYRVLGLNYGAPRVVQLGLGLVNLLLLYLLGRAWFGRVAGLAAAALGAVFWPFIYFEGELNSPVLEVFLYLAMAGALWKGCRPHRWGWCLSAGLLLGLHALVRPNVLLPGVFAAAWLAWAAWKNAQSFKSGLLHAAVFLLAAAVVISPALVRNYRVSGEFVLISYYGGINAYIGNNAGSSGDSPKLADLGDIAGRKEWNCFNYPQLVRGLAEKQGMPVASFSGASRWFYRRALAFWRADPQAALALTARKAALFWGPAEVSDSKVVAIERDHSPLLRRLPGFPAVLALALLGLLFREWGKWGTDAPVALPLTLILGHFLSVLPFFIAGRYRVPVTPFLILFGGAAIARIAHGLITPGQRRRALTGIAVGGILYGAACTPLADYTPSLSTWHYHRGIALADAGRPQEAIAEFDAAVHASQKNAAAWLRLGYACAAAGDAQGAMDAYTNAVIVAPDNALAHNNLGWEMKQAGQTDNARQEFEAALKADPGLEIAAINLANLHVAAGAPDKAVAVYEALLKNNPKAAQARKNLEALQAAPRMQ